ncbi:MAG: hypothetical protein WAN87_04085 [Thermoplasmata archaeon]
MAENSEKEEKTQTTPESLSTDRLFDMKQRVRWAAEIAAEAGEFKDLAFSKALDKLFAETVEGSPSSQLEGRVGEALDSVHPRRATGTAPRKTAKSTPTQLERIRRILDAPPEITSEYAAGLTSLSAKFQIYSALDFAGEKFGTERLTLGELREVLKQTLRIGMPDGTLRGLLSKAPPSEIGRTGNGGRETAYQLMQAGKEALHQAVKSKRAEVAQPVL